MRVHLKGLRHPKWEATHPLSLDHHGHHVLMLLLPKELKIVQFLNTAKHTYYAVHDAKN